jgi:methionyl-tRNA synthetase
MKEALRAAMQISKAGNGFFQDTQIWVVVKTDPDACAGYVSACVGVVALAGAVLAPFMPGFAAKLCAQLGLKEVRVGKGCFVVSLGI